MLRSEIVGAIKMRVFLSGMPELRLGLNDKVLFEHTGSELVFFDCIFLSRYLLCTAVRFRSIRLSFIHEGDFMSWLCCKCNPL